MTAPITGMVHVGDVAIEGWTLGQDFEHSPFARLWIEGDARIKRIWRNSSRVQRAVQGQLWERVAESAPRWTLECGYIKDGVEVIVTRETRPGIPRNGAYSRVPVIESAASVALGITHLVERVTVEGAQS